MASHMTLTHAWSPRKTMISQNTRTIKRIKLESVIRCLTTGQVQGNQFMAVGAQNTALYILNSHYDLAQLLLYPQWIRCLDSADLAGSGNFDIIAGSGDKKLRILRHDGQKFYEFCSTTFDDFVTTCAVLDVTGDGRFEIFAGSWDKTLRMFHLNNETAELEEIWSRSFDKAVNFISVDDTTWDGKYELVVLFKGAGMAVLNAENGGDLWSFDTEKELLGCTIGPLDKSGYPYLVVGGYDRLLRFFNHSGQPVHTIELPQRITSVVIEDIDGGDHREIVAACGDKNLYAIELTGDSIQSMAMKWKNPMPGIANIIQIKDVNRDAKNEIIFAGYDCAVNIIQDYNYDLKGQIGMDSPKYLHGEAAPFDPSILFDDLLNFAD